MSISTDRSLGVLFACLGLFSRALCLDIVASDSFKVGNDAPSSAIVGMSASEGALEVIL